MRSPAGVELTASAPRKRDWLRAGVNLLFVGIFGMLAGLLALGLWWRHDDALRTGQGRAENLALILGAHLGQAVGSVDTALTQLALHSRRVGGAKAAADQWMPVLQETLAGLPGVGSLSIVDDTGVVAQSTIAEIVGQSRENFFSFRRLAQEGRNGMVADTPFRTRTGRLVIPLAERLRTADGSFDGIVVASFEPDRLREFYRSVDVGPDGIVWVLHPAGLVLFREPSATDPMGESAQANPLLRVQSGGREAGMLRGPLSPGGPSYLSAYRRLANPPLVTAVSLAQAAVLADWSREIFIAGGVIGLVGLLLLLSGFRITQEIQARADAETRLVAQTGALTATVSQRDEANAGLRAIQALFQAIMDNSPLTVGVRDPDGRYVFVNRAFERLFGVRAKEVLGKKLDEFVAPETARLFTVDDEAVIANKAPIQREITLPGASPRTILYVKFPFLGPTGEVEAIGKIGTDITDRKQAELELAHAMKMEAVGHMTGGVAHDFNNLLTAILLNADVLVQRLADPDPLRPLAQGMLEAAERGAALTRRLLAFSRRQMLEPESTDVNRLILGMGQLIRRSLGSPVEIVLTGAPDLAPAMVDRGQLETALLNLAVNARDAMPNGGRLSIETANAELDDAYAGVNPDVVPGEYVMIAVADTGTGMSPDVAARAFEPFFTTKEAGRGTGLGLSMVYGFVKQSAGHAKIYSEPGIGTVVRLYLPRSDTPETKTPATPPGPALLPTGTETVLLVEDDSLVRAHTENQLTLLGYRVAAAANAAEAMERLRAGLVPDLLLTDVIMPGMDGRQLAAEVRRQRPKAKVLFMSGYTQAIMAAAPAGPIPAGLLLSKPFRRRDLAGKVREILDGEATQGV